MTPQRMTGIVCTALTSLVILQYSLMGIFDAFTWFCVGVLFVFVASIVWEWAGLKLFQVGTMFLIGGVLQFHGESSAYIGVGIIALTCSLCYAYDFMTKNASIKWISLGVCLVILLSITPYGEIRTTIMRSAMTASMILISWIASSAREKKAKIEAAIKTEHLEKILESTLVAAKVLADEITRRKQNGAE
jgi:hypothetical protein